MRLVVGIPSAGSPAEPFLKSLKSLQLPPSVTQIENKNVSGNFVPAERELIVEYALGRGADFVCMFDDDMVLPPETIELLLQPFADPRVALTGALYYSRDGLRPMTVDNWDPHDTTSAAIPAFDDRTPVEVGGVGFGAVMIRVVAFEKMTPPYFDAQVFLERETGRVRVCNEDYLFCKRLRDTGWRVMLHPGLRAGHYDRASKQIFPLQWESPDHTNSRRMIVLEPDGRIELRPFQSHVARAEEQHLSTHLEYLFVN